MQTFAVLGLQRFYTQSHVMSIQFGLRIVNTEALTALHCGLERE